jgi:hypothetical protein
MPIAKTKALSCNSRFPSLGYFAVFFYIIIILLVFLVVVFSPAKHQIPAVLVSALSFILVSILFPELRFNFSNIITPVNLAMLFFLLQLIVMPFLIMLLGATLYVLPYLPSDGAINVTLLINSLALICFSLGFRLRVRDKRKDATPFDKLPTSVRKGLSPGLPFGAFLLFIGFLSLFLSFGSLNKFINYILYPSSRVLFSRNLEGTWTGVFVSFMKFFLGYGVAVIWAHWVDKSKKRWGLLGSFLALFVASLVMVLLTVSFNRGSMVLPLLALIGVFSFRVKRLAPYVYLVIAVVILAWAFFWGSYRQGSFSGLDVIQSPTAQAAIFEGSNAWDLTQVYFNSPQFQAYLIENTGFGQKPLWGVTILGSIMFPVPQIGKMFRPFSGVSLYNSLIYSYIHSEDQVIPVSGELFINFNIVGIIVGYILIGLLIGFYYEAYLASVKYPSIYSYIILFMGLWTTVGFLSLSLAVTSQLYIYTFFPGYVILIYLRLRKKNTNVALTAM